MLHLPDTDDIASRSGGFRDWNPHFGWATHLVALARPAPGCLLFFIFHFAAFLASAGSLGSEERGGKRGEFTGGGDNEAIYPMVLI